MAKELKRAHPMRLLNVYLHACLGDRVIMCECVCELLQCSNTRVFLYVLMHPWQAGTKAGVISCAAGKAGAAIQSFMSPHNTSRLPVNRLAGRSSSTVLRQTKYFAANVAGLARVRAPSPLTKPSCGPATFLQRMWISRQLNKRNVSHGERWWFSSRAITKLCVMLDIISADWWGVEGV